jgi:predicted transcriptional regulator
MSESSEERTQIEIIEVIDAEVEENIVQSTTLYSNHGTKELLTAGKGKLKGQEVLHFNCNYCVKKTRILYRTLFIDTKITF